MNHILLFLILFFGSMEIYAHSVRGIVKDAHGNSIALVQVSKSWGNIKTYTNSDGFWMLNNIEIGDTIYFSHFKYQSINRIVNASLILNVTLENTAIELQPITIKASKANYIIRTALKKVKDNYITDVYKQYGGVREKLYCDDSLKYLADTEVILTSSYNEKRNDKTTFRIIRSYLPEKQIPLNLINGPSITYLLDEVKSKAKIFNDRKIKLLNFLIKETMVREGRKYYLVQFTPTNNRDIQYSGEIYIDCESMAITHIKIRAEKLANEGSADLEINYQASNGKYWMKSCYVKKTESQRIAGQRSRCRGEVIAVMERPVLNAQSKNGMELEDGSRLNSKVLSGKNKWQGNILALDSTLIREMKPLHLVIDTAAHQKIEMKGKNQSQLIYSPNITIMGSNKLGYSLLAFNETYNSLNRLAMYHLAGVSDQEFLNVSWQLLFDMYVSLPFHGVEAERRILFKNEIKANYNPTPFNRYFTSFCSKITGEELKSLKDNNSVDYLRLHTVRTELNYATIKETEEVLFLKDIKTNYQRQEYFRYYYIDLFVRRIMMMAPTLFSGISKSIPSAKNESDQPLFANRMASYAHYIINPNDQINRNINPDDLNLKEQNYLKSMRWLSLQNLISPLLIAVPPFKIGNQIRFTYSLGYLPSILGDNFSQNLWIKSNSSAYRLTFNEYKSNTSIGYGVGFKIIDTDFLQQGKISTEVNYWKQPYNLSFYPDIYLDGFAVSQQLKYVMGKTDLLLGYRFKTKGYLELSESLNSDFSINIGINRTF